MSVRRFSADVLIFNQDFINEYNDSLKWQEKKKKLIIDIFHFGKHIEKITLIRTFCKIE